MSGEDKDDDEYDCDAYNWDDDNLVPALYSNDGRALGAFMCRTSV